MLKANTSDVVHSIVTCYNKRRKPLRGYSEFDVARMPAHPELMLDIPSEVFVPIVAL